MRDWEVLAGQISCLKEQPCVWIEGTSENVMIGWRLHHRMVIDQLLHIIRLPHLTESNKENSLRFFFQLRAKLIKNSSVCFGLNPFFPSNQASMLVAKAIAKLGESIISILMPSIEKIIGMTPVGDSASFTSYIENDDIDLREFLISSTGKALLYIPGTFLYAKEEPDRLFAENPEFNLTADDLNNLRLVAGAASCEYFDMLEKMHRIRHQKKPSLGYELEKLYTALLRASKKKSGTETESNIHESEKSVAHFYNIWRNKVSPETIKAIELYTVENGRAYYLKSFLLTLFSHTLYTTLPLTREEDAHLKYLRAKELTVFPCAQQIGEQLQLLLAHHPDLLSIPLLGEEAAFQHEEVMPTADSLEALSGQLMAALPQRYPMRGLDQKALSNSHFFNIVATHFTSFNDQRAIPDFDVFLDDLQDMISVFTFLPEVYWPIFVKKNKDKLYLFILQRGEADAITLLLNQLPLTAWKSLFTALFSQPDIRLLLNGYVLACILHELPQSQWESCRDAMENGSKILITSHDWIDFLYAMPVEEWAFTIQLFSTAFQKSFQYNPKLFVDIFKLVPDEIRWSEVNVHALCVALKPVLGPALKTQTLLSDIIKSLPSNKKVFFLKSLLAVYADEITININSFFVIIKTLRKNELQIVLPLFNKKLMAMVFKSDMDIDFLLRRFENNVDRNAFLLSIKGSVPDNIKTSPKTLCDLLKAYPACESGILFVLREQIPNIFKELIITFTTLASVEDVPSLSLQNLFLFLLEKTRAVLPQGETLSENFLTHYHSFFKTLLLKKSNCHQAVQTEPMQRNAVRREIGADGRSCSSWPSSGRVSSISHRPSIITPSPSTLTTIFPDNSQPARVASRYSQNSQTLFTGNQRMTPIENRQNPLSAHDGLNQRRNRFHSGSN